VTSRAGCTAASKGTNGHGLGLLGMKERTLMMGGSYEIKSQPGKGTTVTIAAPFISQHNLIPQ